jgi:hypothetical protein
MLIVANCRPPRNPRVSSIPAHPRADLHSASWSRFPTCSRPCPLTPEPAQILVFPRHSSIPAHRRATFLAGKHQPSRMWSDTYRSSVPRCRLPGILYPPSSILYPSGMRLSTRNHPRSLRSGLAILHPPLSPPRSAPDNPNLSRSGNKMSRIAKKFPDVAHFSSFRREQVISHRWTRMNTDKKERRTTNKR